MHVAVIGAGAAGLASAKYVTAAGMTCEVLEMLPELGGVWIYNEDVGNDKYGFPVYSPMYKDLITNTPKEITCFPDYPMREQDKSYIPQADVLEFLNQYADHFQLRKLIKFNRMVTEVRSLENKWQIKSVDKPSREEFVNVYDAVMVCNGHHNEPMIPKLPGQELFRGRIQHSHSYRKPDSFKNQKVLVIGAGPSGLDLTLHISAVAQSVVFSHHSTVIGTTGFPANVAIKPDVRRIRSTTEIEFVDGSSDHFDSICLCTGYKYNYPFLHESCGITVEDDVVQPLYKHIINIEKPTMCFIGLCYYVSTFHLFDIQVRFFCQYLKGSMTLPSRDMMRLDTKNEVQKRLAKGESKKKFHHLGEKQQEYFDDLARLANITPIQPVISKLRIDSINRFLKDVQHFREVKYKIIDDDTFIQVYDEKNPLN